MTYLYFQLVFGFSSGTRPAIMRSSETFSNGVWHDAVLQRRGTYVLLFVDSYLQINGPYAEHQNFHDLQVPMFFLSYFYQ